MDGAELEQAHKWLGRLSTSTDKLAGFLPLIGDSMKDTPELRTRIATERKKATDDEKSLSGVIAKAFPAHRDDRQWTDIRDKHKEAKRRFEDVNSSLKKKEGDIRAPGAAAGAAAGAAVDSPGMTGAPPRAGRTATAQVTLRQVDLAEHYTEERLQQEKLAGAIEIERDVSELKTIYTEFNDLAQEQGVHLNRAEKNIDTSAKHVEKGVVQLKEANTQQKKGRKWLCVLALILVIIIAIVVVVFVVLKK